MKFDGIKNVVLIPILAVAVSACGGGGGGGGSSSGGSGGVGGTGGSSGATSGGSTIDVTLTGAVTLLAQDQNIVQVSSADSQQLISGNGGKSVASPILHYKLATAATDQPAGNLIKLDANNTPSLAFQISDTIKDQNGVTLFSYTDYGFGGVPKVNYSVANPDHTKVFLVFDNPVITNFDYTTTYDDALGGTSYTYTFTECQLFEVNMADSSYSCIPVVPYTDYWTLSGQKTKSVQFDSAGNAYVLGAAPEDVFSANSTTPATVVTASGWQTGWYSTAGWSNSKYLFKIAPDGTTTKLQITSDADYIKDFVVMKSGEIAYNAYTASGDKFRFARINADGTTSSVNIDNYVTNYAVDYGNTILYNDKYLVRPNPTSGFKKLTLGSVPYNGSTVMADDGNVYSIAGNTIWQILPYQSNPKAVVSGADSWYNSGIKITSGLGITKTTTQLAQHGSIDRMNLVNLSTGKETILFDTTDAAISADPTLSYYQIYSWQVGGQTVYVSALDLSTNTSVMIEIDLPKFKQGLSYLTINPVSSSVAANAQVQDIELVAPVVPDSETGAAPLLIKSSLDVDNPYSVSLQFSKYMNQSQVEAGLSFTNVGTTAAVPYIPFWINKTLHLLPDLNNFTSVDSNGYAVTAPLASNTNYQVSLDQTTFDAYGNFQLQDGDTTTFPLDHSKVILPDDWYNPDTVYSATDANGSIFSGHVAAINSCSTTLAGATNNACGNSSSTYQLVHKIASASSQNMRVELSFNGYVNVSIYPVGVSSQVYAISLNGYSMSDSFYTSGPTSSSGYYYANDTDPSIAEFVTKANTYGPKRLRIETYGTTLKVGISTDGINYTTLTRSIDLYAQGGASYGVYFGAYTATSNPFGISLDNVVVSSLNADGTLASTEGDLQNEDFEAADSSGLTNFKNDASSSNSFGLDEALDSYYFYNY